MIRVGIAGLGFMGRTHLAAYQARDDVVVAAVADPNEAFLAGDAIASNIAGCGEQLLDLGGAQRYRDADAMIADASIDAVDVCVPTLQHVPVAMAAIRAQKHVLIEKPIARTATEADTLVAAAAQSSVVAMPAMCLRYWPGWTWLKDAVEHTRYGACRAIQFTRLGAVLPAAHYQDGAQSGGALLDLHLHDTDFVQHLFGMPRAVTSFGYSHTSGEIDHVVTRYDVEGAELVTAEGAWVPSADFPFVMRYRAHFARATAVYDSSAESTLMLYVPGEPPSPVPLDSALGYAGEIDDFIDAIRTGRAPRRVTLADAANAIRIIEAESKSAAAGGVPVRIA